MRRSTTLPIEPLEPRRHLAAQLVADVNPVSEGTSNANSIVLNDTLYFGWGSGLWKTDGTLEGTQRVAETSPAQDLWFEQFESFPAAGAFLFTGVVEPNVVAVFRSDGTPQGTVRLAVTRSVTPRFHVAGRQAFWFSDDELWVTDGTVGGTAKLAGGLTPVAAAAWDQGLFFLTREAGRMRLWKSDGTAAGTSPVADVAAAVTVSNAAAPTLVATDGRAYLQLVTGTLDGYPVYTLFKSDGTAAGTGSVATLGRSAGGLVGMHGNAYFRNATPSLPGYEPWVSDGMPGGTTRLKDVIPGSTGSNPSGFAVVGDTLYFAAAGNASNPQVLNQVWKSDGTAAGTVLVKAGLAAGGFSGAGGKVYFRAGNGLWATDGTAAGTTEVALPGITPGQFGSHHVLDGGRIAFYGADPVHGWEWRFTDGTAAGTTVLDMTPETAGSIPAGYAELNGKVYFQAADGAPVGGVVRRSLVVSDGTPAGTSVVRSDLPFAGPLVRSGDRLFFAADPRSSTNAYQGLWTTDGTAGDTRMVKSLEMPTFGGRGGFLTDSGGTLFFLGRTSYLEPYTLWRSDGTEAGTVQVSPYRIDDLSPTPPLMAVGRTLYFVAQSPDVGFELFKVSADGGAPTLVKDVLPGSDSNPALLGVMNGRLYFTAKSDADYRYLWSTDGTAAGTTRVSDVPTGPNYGNETPRPRAAVWNGALYYVGGYGTPDAGLWRTDGTAAGTRPVHRGSIDSIYAGGSRLYVAELTQQWPAPTEVTLLASDGTPAGTTPLRRFESVYTAVPHAGRMFFIAREPAYGTELWSTDGTVAGTRIEADMVPGPGNGIDPLEPSLVVAADMLLFTGTDARYGSEPRKWVPGGDPPPAAVTGRLVFYNNSAADGFDPAANSGDDNAIASNKTALLPGQSSAVQNRTNFSRGLNGIFVDVTSLPAGAELSAADFEFRAGTRGDPSEWRLLPGPPTVTVRRLAGGYSADRVTLTWPDAAAARNTWLRVMVKATPRTGLVKPDVFYLGNLVGDAAFVDVGEARVDLGDYATVRSGMRTPFASPQLDFNADGRVNALDLAIVRANLGRFLPDLAPPAETAAPAAAAAVAAPSRRTPPRPRRAWLEVEVAARA
jgi:ELWxxDGT repeat protein